MFRAPLPSEFYRKCSHLLRRIVRNTSISGERFSRSHLRILHNLADEALHPTSSTSDLTLSFLINSCGLSQEAAHSISNRINLKTTENAGSILALLRAHGFATSHIASIITKFPRVLFYDAESNIKPKLEFLLSVGVSNDSLVKLISAVPSIVICSLEKRLRPNFIGIKTICGNHEQFLTNTRRFAWLLKRNFEKEIFPNMKTLEDHGVPPSSIVKLFLLFPNTLLRNPAQFSKSVASLKEAGIDPSAVLFVLGLKVVCMQSNSSWERKLQLYQSSGWSAEETISAFKKFPFCMMISDDKIKRGIDFFVNRLNVAPSILATKPILLGFSLDKRIVPRHNVMNILASKGLKKIFNITTILCTSEKKFIQRYVIKYKDQAPEVLDAYKDKIDAKCLIIPE